VDAETEERKLLEENWAAEWTAARGAVLAYCINALRGNYHTAEDITQQVALRSLRGYRTFRGDSKFLGWVMTIARNEVRREFTRRNVRTNRETPLNLDLHDSMQEEPDLTGENVLPGKCSIEQVLINAAEAGLLSDVEMRIMRLYLLGSELTWAELGQQLGITANAAAVAQCRAVPKLRVFIFMRCPLFLGGPCLIAEAFAAAKKKTAEVMSSSEVEVFEAVIIRHRIDYRKAGWQTNLRTACDKVIRCFPPGSVTDTLRALFGSNIKT
jgi:RNA polymerase sigma factor (sigma-70 family)